jgi:hypothetical protein
MTFADAATRAALCIFSLPAGPNSLPETPYSAQKRRFGKGQNRRRRGRDLSAATASGYDREEENAKRKMENAKCKMASIMNRRLAVGLHGHLDVAGLDSLAMVLSLIGPSPFGAVRDARPDSRKDRHVHLHVGRSDAIDRPLVCLDKLRGRRWLLPRLTDLSRARREDPRKNEGRGGVNTSCQSTTPFTDIG